jgi:hypothetical protein
MTEAGWSASVTILAASRRSHNPRISQGFPRVPEPALSEAEGRTPWLKHFASTEDHGRPVVIFITPRFSRKNANKSA